MTVQLRFPGFRAKALTVSYDDGPVFDERLIDILGARGIRGTYNLNSECMGDVPWRRLTWERALKLYPASGSEVAVHGARHLTLADVDEGRAMRELIVDRENLEQRFGIIVRGSAYANGGAGPREAELIARAGLVYGRTTNATHAFDLPKDWRLLPPTCHHGDPRLTELCEAFLEKDLSEGYLPGLRPQLFYLWGHSYEFNDNDNWEIIEDFARRMGGHREIWYATNYEIWRYVDAYRRLVFSAAGDRVENPTATDVCLLTEDGKYLVPAGETVVLRP